MPNKRTPKRRRNSRQRKRRNSHMRATKQLIVSGNDNHNSLSNRSEEQLPAVVRHIAGHLQAGLEDVIDFAEETGREVWIRESFHLETYEEWD